MADLASINVTINAIDNASGVISGIASELGSLSSFSTSAAGGTAAVNSELANTAKTGTAASSALTAAAKSGTSASTAMASAAKNSSVLKAATVGAATGTAQLEQQLTIQQNTTRQYATAVRSSAAVLREKQAAVQEVARAYKANTTPIKDNISTLQEQQSTLKETITSRQNEITALTEANKTLTKSSQSYKDNQKAIQWTKVELNDAQQKYRAVNTELSTQEKALAAEEAAYKAAQSEVKAAASAHEELRTKMHESSTAEKELSQAITNSDNALTEQQKAISDYAQTPSKLSETQEKVVSVGEQWKQSGKSLKEYGAAIDTLIKPLQYAAVAAIGLGTASASAAINFQDNFASVEKTVEGTDEQLAQIKQDIIDMTTVGINGHSAIPLTTAELTELAAAGGQLGIATENISSFTETMAMLGTATNLSGEQGAQTLARFMNVTSTSQDEISNLGSAIVDLGNNFATTEAEIADMALSMGATGSVVGISAQDVLAYSTALSSLGVEAAAGGSAVARIWMSMQSAVSAGGEDLQKFAELSGESSSEFKQHWQEDASGAFQAFLKGLSESSDQISVLSDLGFSNIRDIQALQRLAGETGFGLLTDAIERANTAWSEDTALLNEFEKKAETTASQIAVTKNNVTEAARSFSELMLPTIVDVTGGLSSMAQGLASMDESGKQAIITGAKGAIILGAASKGFASAVKGAGEMHEAIGKVKENAPKVGAAIASGLTSPVAIAGAAILATGGIWLGLMSNLDKRTEVNENFGESANELSEEFKELNDQTWENNELLKEYQDISNKLSGGSLQGDERTQALERQAELQGQIVEIYGNYISQQEQSTGITSKTIAAIQKRNELELEGKQLEYESGLIGAQKDYTDSQQRISEINSEMKANEENRASAQAMADAYTEYGNALKKIENDESLTSAQRKEKIAEVKEAYADLVDTVHGTSDSAYAAAGRYQTQANENYSNIIELSKELNNLKTQQNEVQTAALNLADVYADKLPEAIAKADGSADTLINTLVNTTKGLGVDNEISQQIALVKNGFENLQDAIDAGALDAVISDYTELGKKFGMTSSEVAAGQSLLQNGFTNVFDAMLAGEPAFNAVQNQFKGLAVDANATSEEMTNAAHQFGLINDSYSLEKAVVNGENLVNTINEAGKVIESFNANQGIDVKINDSGGLDIINNLGETLQSFSDLGAVELKINADTGGIDIYGNDGLIGALGLDENGEFTIKINKEDGEDNTTEPGDKEQKVDKVDGEDNTTEPENEEQSVDKVDGEDNTTEPGDEEQKVDKVDGEDNTTEPGDKEQKVDKVDGEDNTTEPGDKEQKVDKVDGEDNTTEPEPVTVEGTIIWTSDYSGVEDPPEKDGIVKYTADYSGVEDPPEKDGTAKYTGNFDGVSDAPEKDGIAKYTGDFSGVGDPPPLYGTILYTAAYTNQAQGTLNFGGGLAMVNDETGIADNRELIVDQGRAFIPEGRNVILPLSKGAKVYTASQTKRIMASLGIAQYASGKDNDDDLIELIGTLSKFGIASVEIDKDSWPRSKFDSDGYLYASYQDASAAANSDEFGKVKDEWDHYTKTHAVTTSEQLEKWIEMAGQFRDNAEDCEDIAEQIFTYAREAATELNEQSAAYIEERAALNDWEDYGDSAIAAFDRVRDRNMQDFRDGLITWDEYVDNISDIGSAMYDARIEQSENWLEHEEKYNGMSVADYLAGIDRMRTYTQEYYDHGIITYREYLENMSELGDEYIDKRKEQLEEQFNISSDWISERTYFNNWQDYNDDPLSAYNRVKDRMSEALEKGELTQAEYDEYMSELGKQMLDERIDQSENWLSEQRTYFNMSAEEYAEGLERMMEYTADYYNNGLISYREYHEQMTELRHDEWDEVSDAYDDMLSAQKDYISDLQEQFSEQEQALQDSWDVEDRAVDMDEVRAQLEVYSGAVTDAGYQKYKELQEELKQLERDEELYNLQAANNAVIEELQAEYEQLEADKATFLQSIASNTDIDVSGIVSELTSGIEQSSNDITRTLSEIIDAIHGIKMEQQNYTDSRKITNNINYLSGEQLDEFGDYIGR